ncbi:MAG: hypothetical protein GY870_20720 [archaeon]|nr:hypothetical protein [archaeon]
MEASSFQFINGFTIRKRYYDESITLLIMSFSLIFVQIAGTYIHECGHALAVIIYGGRVDRIILTLAYGATYWSPMGMGAIEKAIVALMGTGAIILVIIIICVPCYKKSQNLWLKMFGFWGIVHMSQQLFYWMSGAILGSMDFPWRSQINMGIDALFFAYQLDISPMTVGLVTLPLWILASFQQRKFLNKFVHEYFVDFDLTGQILKNFIQVYVIAIQIFNSLTFAGLIGL